MIAVRQEPLVLVLKVAEVRKLKVLGLVCHTYEEQLPQGRFTGFIVSCLHVGFFCPL